MKRLIVGLVGFKGSGKDTVGDILHQHLGFQKTSFADPVKKSLAAMFDWSDEMLEGRTLESRDWRESEDDYWSDALGRSITPRIMMQEFGTELVRQRLHNDFWTIRCRKFLEKSTKDVVVTDLRFCNEIQMVRDLGGIIIWVRKPTLPDHFHQSLWYNNQHKILQIISKPFLTNMNKVHISERDWIGSKFDYVIDNDSTLEVLEYKVRDLYNLF